MMILHQLCGIQSYYKLLKLLLCCSESVVADVPVYNPNIRSLSPEPPPQHSVGYFLINSPPPPPLVYLHNNSLIHSGGPR